MTTASFFYSFHYCFVQLNNSRFASHVKFPWQYENPTHLPGGSQSVAHQFIRCVLHQLAPNGIFVQMFLTQMKGTHTKYQMALIRFAKQHLLLSSN